MNIFLIEGEYFVEEVLKSLGMVKEIFIKDEMKILLDFDVSIQCYVLSEDVFLVVIEIEMLQQIVVVCYMFEEKLVLFQWVLLIDVV